MKSGLLKRILAVTALTTVLTTAGLSVNNSVQASQLSDKTITIGVTGGPHEQIAEQVKKLAKKDGLTVKVKVFSDYNTPNSALQSGDLDANSYQTLPFLKEQEKNKGYKFKTAFKTISFPMGIYSKKIKSIKDLKKGDTIAVPNDPANETRALQLFQKAGVIKLKKGVGQNATKNTIASNPKHVKIVELDAAQLPRQLGEVTAAAINGNYAQSNGLSVKNDSLFHEPLSKNQYPNYFVVKTGHQNDKVIKQLEKYYHSKAIKKFAKEEFKGSVFVSD